MGSISLDKNLPTTEIITAKQGTAATSLNTDLYTIGRVVEIELNNPALLGVVTYVPLYNTPSGTSTARPYSSNIKHYPEVNEIVLIVKGPSTGMNDGRFTPEEYYLPPFSMWSTNHYNTFPNQIAFVANADNSQINLQQVEQGLAQTNQNYVDTTAKTPDKADIKTLKPFSGDIIVEGRWGHSIRFGSTSPKPENKWSAVQSRARNQSEEVIGDPILIISNGHTTGSKEPWSLITEDLDTDKSSIWMTSTQQVTIKDIQTTYSLESFTSLQEVDPENVLSIIGLPTSYRKTSRAQQDRVNNK